MVEQARTDILGQQTDNKSGNITKEQLATILNKYFETTDLTLIPDEISSEQGHDLTLTTKDNKYTIMLSEIFKGTFASKNLETFGEKYEDSMIGKTIQYTSGTNNVTDWIILGKQINEQGKNDIIITTKNPVSTLQITATLAEWTGFETKVSNACKTYVGETGIFGTKTANIKEVRNIKIEDINSMVGFNNKVNNIILGGEANDYAYPKSDGSGWIVKGQDSNYQMWNFQEIESYSIANDNGTYLWFNNNRME